MTVNREDQRAGTAADITSILVRNCGLDADAAAAAPTASLEELGMDSLALLELQAVVAKKYQVQIPEDAKDRTIDDIAAFVDGRSGSSEPPAHTENSIVIGAPLDLVWEITNDVAHWTELFTEYQSVEVLERQGNTVRFRLTMFPDDDGVAWSWVSERTVDPANYEVHAHRVETGPFEYMRIHWRYEDLSGATRMTWTQDFAMRPEAPVTNSQMADVINNNTKVQMKVIRERIEHVARERVVNAPAGAGRE